MEDDTKPHDAVSDEESKRERASERLFAYDDRRADPALTQSREDRPPLPWETRPESWRGSTPAQPPGSTPPAERVGSAPVTDESTVSMPAPSIAKPAPAPPPPPSPPPPARPTPPPAKRPEGAVQVRRLRRGRLAIRKIDPWAVFKFSLVFYFCMLLIALLVVGIIFVALKAFGVIDNLQKLLRDLDFYVQITGGVIFRWVFLLGLAGTLVASVVTMFMAFLYNLIADVVGGLEMVVTERE